jgi:antitoxin component of MazEF toxin-antitoxin module
LKSKNLQVELSVLVEKRRLSVRRLEKLIAGGLPIQERVEKRGDALYIRIPDEVVRRTHIRDGEMVYVYAESKRRIALESVSYKASPSQEIPPVLNSARPNATTLCARP